MDALILSCSTGGGHNVAAEAVKEELERRGHHADFLDPYTLCGEKTDEKVGNCYIKCAQKLPRLFGFIYRAGDLYRRLPGKSPVYWGNRRAAERLGAYLERRRYDVILTTHLFPGEMLTHLRRKKTDLPKIVFIATDYTCIPFTEETECDYYIVPSHTEGEFFMRGIPAGKVIPIGIPVKQGFGEEVSREKAIERLGLNPEKRYAVVAGGSMGAGRISGAIEVLHDYLSGREDMVLIVICGTNRKLYEKLKRQYGEERGILLLKRTECMAEYLKACDFYVSKPGGISSTEAAVANVPLIHISPIPGCETKNERFFADNGMSIRAANIRKELPEAVRRVGNADVVNSMKMAQHRIVDPLSAEKTVCFVEKIVKI